MIGDLARRQILDAKRCVIALSGGLDSVVLLELVAALRPRDLLALHVDHQLFPTSGEVADFCRRVCQDLQVDCEVVQVDVSSQGSIEARAREARYAAFEAFLKPADLLLQAHHADDQIETLMLALFRGSRAPGLRGMPMARTLGSARLIRPLLDVSRADIQQYAEAHALLWREDPTNSDLSIDRNYIRHSVLPLIDTRFPHARTAMLRGIARDARFEKRLSEADHQVLLAVRHDADSLELAALSALSLDTVRATLDCWLTSLDIPRISGRCLDEMAARIVDGAEVDIAAGELMFRQHDSKLFVLKLLQESHFIGQPLGSNVVDIPGGILSNEIIKGFGLKAGTDYRIDYRTGGEKIRIGRNRSLKNLFRERHVPVWLRDRLPLIYAGKELVAIAGLADWDVPMMLADGWGARPGDSGVKLLAAFEDRAFQHASR